ncbi:acyltransferase family protein [Mycobacterium sp. UM_CSW]|uniref:acyltransferase family protein n=1 Tax=Mycobacterium sp. UM_CSW TaxID=1370119 RepID=UPI0004038D4B|nr:acyltransferase family protein [Mycobacterium sp. UM_CSW]
MTHRATAHRGTTVASLDAAVARRSRLADAGPSPAGRRGDRFRPDIEGMRAVAVGLVLLFHGYGKPFTGGFVGVDVFFVISGFLITGLLLHEQINDGRISLWRFYARRVRRILPAATLTVLVTIFAAYQLLGFISGNEVANDAKWTAVFAANIHFAEQGTDYLGSRLPPSPLQHMWSLGVEEQFYLAWPTLFLLVAIVVRLSKRRNVVAVLTSSLLVVIGTSLAWSVVQTSSNATWAYFSPLTRAWELALGALIAVLGPALSRAPQSVHQVSALLGLAGIAASALILTSSMPYPGWAVAIPVVGSAMLIAAGCGNPQTVVGRVLSVRPMQWLGARSYSLYLWHWPILVIAARYAGHQLSAWQNSGLLLAAVAASAITFRLIENPVRQSAFLRSRTQLTLAIGVALTLVTVAVAQHQIASHERTWNPPKLQPSSVGQAQVLEAVQAAQSLNVLPKSVADSLTKLDLAKATGRFDCYQIALPPEFVDFSKSELGHEFGQCAAGAEHGTKLMVTFGDSRAWMWGAALEGVAAANGYKLRTFYMNSCPALNLHFLSYQTQAPNDECYQFHRSAVAAIRKLHPDLVIATGAGTQLLADGSQPTAAQWQEGWASTFRELAQPQTRFAMLGAIPTWEKDDAHCLAAHASAVQQCSVPRSEGMPSGSPEAEQAAASAAGALYVPTVPWVCANRCEPVIADIRVYYERFHFSRSYATYLTGAVGEALRPVLT